jgi:DNA invertase Pin-like site-specific DNA recombinase
LSDTDLTASLSRRKALGYIRVSTDEQADSGLGLDAQRAAITAEAEHRGWDLEIVEDAGFTGRNMRRPALTDALTRLDNCQSETSLIVAKLDRLSRSLIDFASVMERSKKNGWALVCLDLGVDTSTPQGKMVANIFATFAEFESDLIGQRTKAALDEKRKQGVKLGRPRTVCDEALRLIHIARRNSLSYAAIAADLNQRSVPTAQGGRWWPETVRLIDQRD